MNNSLGNDCAAQYAPLAGPFTPGDAAWRDNLFIRIRKHVQQRQQMRAPSPGPSDDTIYSTPAGSSTATLVDPEDERLDPDDNEKIVTEACGLATLDIEGNDPAQWEIPSHTAWLEQKAQDAYTAYLQKVGLQPPPKYIPPPPPKQRQAQRGITSKGTPTLSNFNPLALPYVPAAVRAQLALWQTPGFPSPFSMPSLVISAAAPMPMVMQIPAPPLPGLDPQGSAPPALTPSLLTSPGLTPRPAPAPAPERQEPEPFKFGVRQPWIRAFRAGTVTRDHTVRRSLAQTVVENGGFPWTMAGMAELAAKFCERATEGGGVVMDVAPVAPFARCVLEAFAEDLGEEARDGFGTHLMQHVGVEFCAWWQEDRPTAVAKNGPPRGAPALPSPLLASALAMAAFVGDLFTQGIAPSSVIINCFKMLIKDITVLEELRAIREILTHCDERLYSGAATDAFMEMIEGKVMAGIKDNASVVGEKFGRAELQELMKELKELVTSWKLKHLQSEPTPTYASHDQ